MSDAGEKDARDGVAQGENLLRPTTAEDVRQIVQDAAARREAIYPVGGGLALDELLPKPRPGIDLSLTGLDRIVEFSPRDLTITVEAGMTLANLARTVDEAGLLFPFASRFDERSTIGGLIATAWNGPRRTGWGNLRDYVIGVRAIDGRGVAFKSGGKVVKNVAGYDLVKLLVGSRGTLGIVTEVTLRLKPRPEAQWGAVLIPTAGQSLAQVCADFQHPKIPYSQFEVPFGIAPNDESRSRRLEVFLDWEGPVEEIEVAKAEIETLMRSGRYRVDFDRDHAFAHDLALDQLTADFQVLIQGPPATTLRAIVDSAPSFPDASGGVGFLSPRAGKARLFFPDVVDTKSTLIAVAALRERIGDDGYVTVLRDRKRFAPTRELRFGRTSSPQFLMEKVKAAMDPQGILNPGRYVFADANAPIA